MHRLNQKFYDNLQYNGNVVVYSQLLKLTIEFKGFVHIMEFVLLNVTFCFCLL